MCPAVSSANKPTSEWSSIVDTDFWTGVFDGYGFPKNEQQAREAYKANKFYERLGSSVDLSTNPERRPEADWAFATFSLTYPLVIPVDVTENLDSQGSAKQVGDNQQERSPEAIFTTNLNYHYWNAGRFKGFSRFRFQEGSKDWEAQTYYQRGSHRYPQDFADTIDAWELQRLPCAEDKKPTGRFAQSGSGSRNSADDHGRKCHASHLLFKQIEGVTSFQLGDSHDDSSDKLQGVLRLVAIELIEYKRRVNPDHAAENIDRFLNLHFILEWPSCRVLDQVSAALHRSRNRLRILPPSATPLIAPPEGSPSNYRLPKGTDKVFRLSDEQPDANVCKPEMLTYFLEVVADQMVNKLVNEEEKGLAGSYRITHDRGNTLIVKQRKPHNDSRENDTQSREAQTLQSFVPVAYRTVCAVPNKASIEPPRLFLELKNSEQGSEASSSKQQLVHTSWAWTLATGADIYYDDIPSTNALRDEEKINSFSRYWTISSDQSGIAFVRNPVPRASSTNLGGDTSTQYPEIDVTSNPKLYMLVSTQMLDLAILSIRVEIALSLMQAELDQDNLATDSLSQSVDSGDVEKLAGVVERLQTIHKLHLAFRRDLWFESIPGRPTDNAIMQSMLESRDNKAAYSDFRAELDLHKEILEAAFKRQSDHKDQEEQKLKERQNQILTIIALFLGFPAWVELFGFDFNLSTGGWTLFGAFVLLLIIVSGYRIGDAMKARQRRKNATKR